MMYGIDVETTALNPQDGDLRLVQLSNGTLVRVFDLYHEEHDLVRDAVQSKEELVAHNATFERTWLNHGLDIDRPDLHDTMVMSQVLYGETDAARSPRFSHSLAAVSKREIDIDMGKEEQTSDWSDPDLSDAQIAYAGIDAATLPELADELLGKLEDAGLMEVYELERRVSHAVDAMERNGFAVHEGRLAVYIQLLISC